MRFKKLAVSALVIGFASLGVIPANAVTSSVTTNTCPAGATLINNNTQCSTPGVVINYGQSLPYLPPGPNGNPPTSCQQPGATFNEANWPAWYCWKLGSPTITSAITPTQTGCPALQVRKDSSCYTMTEYASIGTMGPFGTVADWAKTYLLPAIIALALIGIAVRLGIGASRKYLNNLKG